MDFFIPSLLVLLISAIVIFFLVPKLGPVTMLILSIALLLFAVMHHIKMYKSEYTLSTWPMLLSTYGPYIVLGTVFIFILFFIFSSYGGPSVPIPEVSGSPVVESANSIINGIKNAMNNTVSVVKNTVVGNTVVGNNASRNGRNNISKSFFNVV
jgi:hypothetical protein